MARVRPRRGQPLVPRSGYAASSATKRRQKPVDYNPKFKRVLDQKRKRGTANLAVAAANNAKKKEIPLSRVDKQFKGTVEYAMKVRKQKTGKEQDYGNVARSLALNTLKSLEDFVEEKRTTFNKIARQKNRKSYVKDIFDFRKIRDDLLKNPIVNYALSEELSRSLTDVDKARLERTMYKFRKLRTGLDNWLEYHYNELNSIRESERRKIDDFYEKDNSLYDSWLKQPMTESLALKILNRLKKTLANNFNYVRRNKTKFRNFLKKREKLRDLAEKFLHKRSVDSRLKRKWAEEDTNMDVQVDPSKRTKVNNGTAVNPYSKDYIRPEVDTMKKHMSVLNDVSLLPFDRSLDGSDNVTRLLMPIRRFLAAGMNQDRRDFSFKQLKSKFDSVVRRFTFKNDRYTFKEKRIRQEPERQRTPVSIEDIEKLYEEKAKEPMSLERALELFVEDDTDPLNTHYQVPKRVRPPYVYYDPKINATRIDFRKKRKFQIERDFNDDVGAIRERMKKKTGFYWTNAKLFPVVAEERWNDLHGRLQPLLDAPDVSRIETKEQYDAAKSFFSQRKNSFPSLKREFQNFKDSKFYTHLDQNYREYFDELFAFLKKYKFANDEKALRKVLKEAGSSEKFGENFNKEEDALRVIKKNLYGPMKRFVSNRNKAKREAAYQEVKDAGNLLLEAAFPPQPRETDFARAFAHVPVASVNEFGELDLSAADLAKIDREVARYNNSLTPRSRGRLRPKRYGNEFGELDLSAADLDKIDRDIARYNASKGRIPRADIHARVIDGFNTIPFDNLDYSDRRTLDSLNEQQREYIDFLLDAMNDNPEDELNDLIVSILFDLVEL